MTGRLRDHVDDLEALVDATAGALGIDPTYVEKDFWATEVLRVASVPITVDGMTTRFLFKGGTSLSRVFGITERFSDDIDLLAEFPKELSKGKRHAVLKQVDSTVTAHLGIASRVSNSDTGVKRYTRYAYATSRMPLFSSPGVLLELGSRGGTNPSAVHSYRSLVAVHAVDALGEAESEWDEFAPFPVATLAPERTLLEKLAAVHAAVVHGDTGRVALAGRHFYDIVMLLRSDQVLDALERLGPAGVAALAEDVHVHSEMAGFISAERPARGYAASPAFDAEHDLHDKVKAGYAASLGLVHGSRPTMDDVLSTVAGQAACL